MDSNERIMASSCKKKDLKLGIDIECINLIYSILLLKLYIPINNIVLLMNN